MNAISPPPSPGLSTPAAPRSCSASRSPARRCSAALQAALAAELTTRLNGHGSTIYLTGWKDHTTPSGRVICRLRARAPRTSDSGAFSAPSGWPTPDAQAMNLGADPARHQARLRRLAKKHGNGNGAGLPIAPAAHLAGWPTPTVRDHKDGMSVGSAPVNALLGRAVWLAGWPEDAGPARLRADGTLLTGSSARMAAGGRLNPRFSGWLMGFPPSWCAAALSCPRISRSPRRRPSAAPTGG